MVNECDICGEGGNIRAINDFRLCPSCYNGLKLQSGDVDELVTDDWDSPNASNSERGHDE